MARHGEGKRRAAYVQGECALYKGLSTRQVKIHLPPMKRVTRGERSVNWASSTSHAHHQDMVRIEADVAVPKSQQARDHHARPSTRIRATSPACKSELPGRPGGTKFTKARRPVGRWNINIQNEVAREAAKLRILK